MEKVYPLNTDFNFHFIILGVGGTGSELVPKLCRQLSFKIDEKTALPRHSIILADKDKVESKNLLRQNFLMADLNKNKAERMAYKCSTVFNLPVAHFTEFVESDETVQTLIDAGEGRVPFIVGCLDNVPTRIMLHNFVTSYTAGPIFYLDAGNSEFAGQAVLATNFAGKTNRIKDLKDGTYHFNLPDVIDHFPNMLESTEKFASELSCAELAESDPQAADVNVESAGVLYQFIMNCLRGKIEYHMVTFHVIYGNRRVTYNDDSLLRAYGVTGLPKVPGEKRTPKKRASAKAAAEPAVEITPTEPEMNLVDIINEGNAAAEEAKKQEIVKASKEEVVAEVTPTLSF